MQIRLTRRRLTLAVFLVLAVVAAPLAWAAVGGNPASLKPSAASTAAHPTATLSPASPAAASSTGDNPYQYMQTLALPGGSAPCTSLNLPVGTNFALSQVSVGSTVALQGAVFQTASKVPPPIDGFLANYAIPVDPQNSGILIGGTDPDQKTATRNFDLYVKPGPPLLAAAGDIYGLIVCVGSSSPGTAVITLTGQKVIGNPTPVMVRDFTARPRAQGAALRWTTGSESTLLGFNVWRFRGVKGVKINRTLIRAKRSGEPAGASYSFVDTRPGARRGLSYRLQLVDVQGKRTWYAAFAIPA
jgi:hypothetical protein